MKKIILPLVFVSVLFSSFILQRNKLTNEIISTPHAILIMPTVGMIEESQKADEENYNTILNDNMNYLDLAREHLESLEISIVDTEAEGKLKFKTAKNENFEVDLSQNAWKIVLFNGTDEPIQINAADYEIEIKKYMK
jgi:hypothetical protein